MGLYASSIGFDFVAFDDPWLIADNPILTSQGGFDLGRVLFDFSAETRMILGAEYLPVRDIAVWLDGQLFGEWVGGRHLVNVALYALVIALFAMLSLRVFPESAQGGRWAAWCATLVFALHPTHVEVVAWLSERKGLLATSAVLAAVLFAERFARRGQFAFALAALVSYAFAVFSKSVSVVTPAAFAALYWLFDEPVQKKRAFVLAGTALVLGAILIQPTLAVGSSLSVIQADHHDDFASRVLLFLELHGRYLGLMFLALPNAPHYPVDAEQVHTGFAVLGMLGLLAALAALAKRRPVLSFGALWWLVFLFPVSHLVFSLQNLMADRYLLLPSVGFSLVVAALLSRLSERLRTAPLLLFAGLAGVLTMLQLPAWKDSEALFHRLVDLQPSVSSHWSQWAAHLAREGRAEDAWAVTQMGIERAGTKPGLLHRRGLLRMDRGEAVGGFADIEKAARDPDAKPKYQANYALLLLQGGRSEEARKYAMLAAERAPLYAHMQRVLGLVELQLGNRAAARRAFERALRLEPHNPINRKNLEVAKSVP